MAAVNPWDTLRGRTIDVALLNVLKATPPPNVVMIENCPIAARGLDVYVLMLLADNASNTQVILRNSQFSDAWVIALAALARTKRALGLINMGMGDLGVGILCGGMVESASALRHLLIEQDTFGIPGYHMLASATRKLDSLKLVNAFRIPSGTSLRELTILTPTPILVLDNNGINDDLLHAFVAGFVHNKQINRPFKQLFLNRNPLTRASLPVLLEMLNSDRLNGPVEVLECSNLHVTDRDVEEVMDQVTSLGYPKKILFGHPSSRTACLQLELQPDGRYTYRVVSKP